MAVHDAAPRLGCKEPSPTELTLSEGLRIARGLQEQTFSVASYPWKRGDG
eukprot:CAMPEP_0119058364 /NCGR_PEP_ID=MMETSP1178-20130426/2728_1 /TAXON_ID=33656 /ORGANISM="unid sp, Strain CCMP2000" /LENGTH=49 /DNA_ID= /DNA_START= /DNA_END= /DNA_ORIENTATION=